MLRLTVAFAALATAMFPLTFASPIALYERQAANPGFANDPLSQTASLNMTTFVLPIKKAMAQQIVGGGRKLLPPQGLPADYLEDDEHPLIVSVGKLNDIRQIIVQIQQLQLAQVLVPFVDATNDGSTAYSFEPVSLQDQLIPVLAGTLQQQTGIQLANFNPPHAAFQTFDNQEGQFGMDINQGLPKQANILGAPVPNLPSFTGVWNAVDNQTISEQFYKGVLSAPYIHTYNGLCSKTTYDWDEKFAEPFFVEGDFQTYPPITPSYTQAHEAQGFHIVAGWDNEFGPGKKCEEYKEFAAGIQYE